MVTGTVNNESKDAFKEGWVDQRTGLRHDCRRIPMFATRWRTSSFFHPGKEIERLSE